MNTPDEVEAELAAMKAKGREVKPQIPHESRSGKQWEPDEKTKRDLGDAYPIMRAIIEES